MGFRPPVKTGLNVRNWVRINPVLDLPFHPFLHRFTLPGIPVTPWFQAGLSKNCQKGENVA